MNTIITTYNGGMPLVLDDLQYIQNNVLESLIEITNSLSSNGNADKMILSGLEVNADTMNKGALVYNNQIYTISNDISVPNYPTNYEFYYIPSFDANGDKIYKNSLTHSTYKLTKIGCDTTDNINGMSGVEWREDVASFYRKGNTSFEALTLSDSSIVMTDNLKIRFLPNNKVNIVGTLTLSRSSSDTNRPILGNLPAKYVPSDIVNIVMGNENGGSPSDGSIGSLLITQSGAVALRVNENITYGLFYLNSEYSL